MSLAFAHPPVFDATGIGDLTTLLRLRLEHQDTSVIGFYQQSARTHRVESQQAFLRRAARLGTDLIADGARPGDRIVVACSAPEAALLAFCATVLIGAVPTIVAGRVAFDDADVVVQRVTDTLGLLGGASRLILQSSDDLPALDVVLDTSRLTQFDPTTLSPIDDVAELGGAPRVAATDGCHIQLTSGSTGNGRGIVVNHGNLMANCDALRTRLELAPGDVFASWLPLNHDMGLVAQALLALIYGVDLYLLSPIDFVADPLAWLRTISERGGTAAASPNFGYHHALRRVGDADLAELDLSQWRSACCGAEPISTRVAESFSSRFASAGLRPTAFTPCYGLAEATLAVTMANVGDAYRSIRVTRPSLAKLGAVVVSISSGEPHDDEIDVMAIGTPVEGVSVRLIDRDGATIDQPLVCGEVIVTGPSIAGGTIGADGTVVPFPEEGLHTGDVGFMQRDELFVVERTKNVLIRNGRNYSGLVLEQTLARLAGVGVHHALMLDADLAGGSGLTGVVALARGADPAAALEAVEHGLADFELSPEVVVAVKPGSLPVTTSGKKRHAAVREMLRTGSLKVIATRNMRARVAPASAPQSHSSDLARRVLALVAEQVRGRGLDVPVLPGSSFAHDLDLDSLALLELAVAVEDRLGVTIPEQELGQLLTVADLIAAARTIDGRPGSGGITATLMALERSVPQTYRSVEGQRNREVLIDGRWVADFASCNYLGMDLHPEVIGAIPAALSVWGVHPSWTRAVASPAPYRLLEQRLATLVGVHDTIVFPTVTLLHFGVLPRLAGGSGAILLDNAAHNSMHEAGALARERARR
ncbi:MAG: AMP-binding protein [Acidimicrobiales bacterium]